MTKRKKKVEEPVVEEPVVEEPVVEEPVVEEPVVEEPVVEVEGPKALRVREGVTITSRKGILKSGTVVLPKFFSGGQVTIDNLIKRGHVV